MTYNLKYMKYINIFFNISASVDRDLQLLIVP